MADPMKNGNHGMNGTMKAVSQDELGGPEVLKLVTLPTPEPGVSEILIRVHAAGVNPIDGAQRQTGAFVGQPPFVLGWDISGTVEAVGQGVTLYKPGDAVFGMLPFPQGHGAYAEYAVGPTRVFVPAGYPLPSPAGRSLAAWLVNIRGREWSTHATGMSCWRGSATTERACVTWSGCGGARASPVASAGLSMAAGGRWPTGCVAARPAGRRPRSPRGRSSPARARRW
jgi:hypothetical protein